MPFPDVEVSDSFLRANEHLIGEVGLVLLRHALEHPKTTDRDLDGALEKMIRTYETLSSGIYYESAPEEPSQIGVFRGLKSFFGEYQERLRKQEGMGVVKESDVIRSLVFLSRLAAVHSTRRLRSRALIEFFRHR